LPFRRRLRGESGAAIVEFTLMLPFICLIVVLTIDVGRAFNYWVDATHLATEGARMAAVDRVPDSAGSLQEYIRNQANTHELREGGTRAIAAPLEVCVDEDPEELGGRVGDPVEVEVTATYHWLPIDKLPVIDVEGLADTEIKGKATMRREVLAEDVTDGCEE